MTPLKKYMEYLSPDEISKYVDPTNGELVEWRIPRNIVPKRRQTAWEFMGQEPTYISCVNKLFEGRKAEASSSSAPAEDFDVDAEIRCVSSVSPHRTIGQKVCDQFNEAVIVVRGFWRMSESRQKNMSEGITRHVWEKCPLSGHSVLFVTRAWELGRMTA